jgi:triphosphoribosyl-dephospho-CoA synthase
LTRWLAAACWLEAAACKAGNVHPSAGFADLSFADFETSARLAAPELAASPRIGIGRAVLAAVTATRTAVHTNTNLGIALLLAPLAAVPGDRSLSEGIDAVLGSLDVEDARQAYAAIRLACAGGLGTADNQDVGSEPTVTLLEAMRLASDRDMIARQYATAFATVFAAAEQLRIHAAAFACDWNRAIQQLQLRMLSEHADSLIARKCGTAVAAEAKRRATSVLESGGLATLSGQAAWHEFDAWLRADGHRRNPGTTADLIAAALFVSFREGWLDIPADVPMQVLCPTHGTRT